MRCNALTNFFHFSYDKKDEQDGRDLFLHLFIIQLYLYFYLILAM